MVSENLKPVISFTQELRELFEPYGTIVEADAISGKNYGFIHIDASIGRTKLGQLIKQVPLD